jgi:cytosine deaminase
MVDRALTYCDWAVSMGLLAIRTHVDTCARPSAGVEAMLEVKKPVAPYLTCNWSPSRRTGSTAADRRARMCMRALDMGVDVVGGIPHFERTMEEGAARARPVRASPPNAA